MSAGSDRPGRGLSRRERRRRDEQRVLASLIKWAQDHPFAPGYAAGPTTDPATVADRIMRGGRIKVRTKGVPLDEPGFWTPDVSAPARTDR